MQAITNRPIPCISSQSEHRVLAEQLIPGQNPGMKMPTFFKAFIAIGLGLLLAAAYFKERADDLVDVAHEAPGVVVAVERRGNGTFSPVVEWTDHTGTKRKLYSAVSTQPPRFFEGEQVSVLYDPADPKYPVNARIKSTLELWGAAIFFFVFGCFWLFVTIVSWYVWSKGGIVVFGEENYPGRPDPDFPTT